MIQNTYIVKIKNAGGTNIIFYHFCKRLGKNIAPHQTRNIATRYPGPIDVGASGDLAHQKSNVSLPSIIHYP